MEESNVHSTANRFSLIITCIEKNVLISQKKKKKVPLSIPYESTDYNHVHTFDYTRLFKK